MNPNQPITREEMIKLLNEDLAREYQAPFRKKLFHKRLHFLFQEGFGVARDDEIIRKPDHVDFRPCVALEGRKGTGDVSL